MSPTLKRVLSISSIVLCGIIILLCMSAALGVWLLSGKIIAAGTTLLSAAEKGAAAVQIGLTSIDDELTRMEEGAQSIEDATAQLSQNISDKGFILVLLPPAKEEKLTNSVAAINNTVEAVEQMLSSVIDTLQFIDSMPFAEVPKPDPDTVTSVFAKVEKINSSVEKVQKQMQEVRDNVAGATQRVSDAVGEINNDIEAARAEVDARNESVAAIQESLTGIKESLPMWVYLGALLVTFLFAWIIYTQVLIIQWALAKYKAA